MVNEHTYRPLHATNIQDLKQITCRQYWNQQDKRKTWESLRAQLGMKVNIAQ